MSPSRHVSPRRRKPWQNTSLSLFPLFPFSFPVGLLLLRDISGVCRGKRVNEEHVVLSATSSWWAGAASASRGVTRNVTRFRRHNYARGARIPTVTRTRERERRKQPRKIFTPPGRNIGRRRRRRRVTREHPVNSSRGNRVTRLDDRGRERKRGGEFARQFFTVITRV